MRTGIYDRVSTHDQKTVTDGKSVIFAIVSGIFWEKDAGHNKRLIIKYTY